MKTIRLSSPTKRHTWVLFTVLMLGIAAGLLWISSPAQGLAKPEIATPVVSPPVQVAPDPAPRSVAGAPPTPTVFTYLPVVLKNWSPPPMPTATPRPPGLGSARGRILWNDQPASGASSRLCENVSFFGGCSGREYETLTGADGWYLFTDVVAGSYVHLARLAGETRWWYKSRFLSPIKITITEGETTLIDDFHAPKTDLVLQSPPDDSTVEINRPTLAWAAYPSVAYYEVTLQRRHPSYQMILNEVRVDGTSITVSDPLSTGEYSWGVKAYNANNHEIARSREDFQFAVP